MTDSDAVVIPLRASDPARLLACRLDPEELQDWATDLAHSIGAFLCSRDPELLGLIREQAESVAFHAGCIEAAVSEEVQRIRRAPINAAAKRRRERRA